MGAFGQQGVSAQGDPYGGAVRNVIRAQPSFGGFGGGMQQGGQPAAPPPITADHQPPPNWVYGSARQQAPQPPKPPSKSEAALAAWAGPGYQNPAQQGGSRPRLSGKYTPRVWA